MKAGKMFHSVIILLAVIFISAWLPTGATAANAASNTTLMTKYLKNFKKGKYKKAASYAKKLKKTNKDTSLKKMKKAQKKAYRNIVKQYKPYEFGKFYTPYMWGYYLADLDGDRSTELLIQYGSNEADVRMLVYTYKSGKATQVEGFYCSHASFYAYPGKGIVMAKCHMGSGMLFVMTMKDGHVVSEGFGTQVLRDGEDYCLPGKAALYNHIKWAQGNAKADYKDLK